MNFTCLTTGLSKTYGKTQALSCLSLKIEAGFIYGLIGPNGAGKTTSLAVLAGLIAPTSGTAWILGRRVRSGCRELASKVGFCSPQFPLLDYLTGLEMLSACGLLHGLARQDVKTRTNDLLDLMDLQPAAGQYIGHYSQGMRRKIGLACALVHRPEILLLDEPFHGLDPISIYRLVTLFRQLAANGRTIILSSHNMALVERLCNRVGILHKGVLQKEISISPQGAPGFQVQSDAAPYSMLESALWEVVGTPVAKPINWM
jgi:ABC-2 type transport system ATP-binding protein